MDKKNQGKRLMKTKGHPPPGDFIALGSKQDLKPTTSVGAVRKPSTSLGVSSVKRDAPSSIASSSLATKKPKLSSGQTFTPLGRPSDEKKSLPPSASSSVVHQYEEIALEVEPENLMDGVMEAEADGDDEKIERLLCGAVKYLKNNRAKPESSLFLTLMYLAKTRPQLYYNSEVVIEAFCCLLKRDVSLNFKTKGNALVSVLSCNTLMAAFSLERNWPEAFLKVFLEDSLGERVWVDRADCRAFSENIQTGFSTKMPKPYIVNLEAGRPDQSPTSSTSHSPVPGSFTAEDDDRSLESFESQDRPSSSLGQDQEVFPRYTYQQVSVEMHVVEVIKEQLNRRQLMDGGSRNLVRVMTACCGYSEVRMLAAQRLEMWLQNPKLTRPAQDLLMGVCLNCDQHSPLDIEVLSLLSKVRLKTKPLVNHYLLAMREALNQHVDNMRTLMTHTIYNELSNSRNPNNMALLQAMFQHNSELAAKMMAEIFQDLLCNRDDYLRALRALLREIIRSLRHDMNFTNFALGLMTSRTERKFTEMELALKERLLHSITDLITLTSLLSISPIVRETFTAFARGEYKDVEALFGFQNQAAVIQRDAVSWLHSVVPAMFDAKPQELNFCLRKVLFMEKMEQYYKLDNWPPEGDRGLMLRIVSEIPLLEDSLMRVLIMGLNKDFFPNPPDALDLADQMVRRAAIMNHEGHEVLKITRTKLFDAIFNLCAYHPPDNTVLPKGYTAPAYAISNHYWKAWAMLLVIASFNPSTIGKAAWDTYPTLRCFMQMIMTNNFKFPPPTMASDEQQAEEIRARERQISELERQQILEFEGHLASVTITEANSLLLAQLTTLDPGGLARKPPPGVLEQLRSLNQSLQLGAMLCRCRDPDFLLDIIHTQGTSQSMPWLADLVESSDSSLDVLPVQCLCEFLLHDDPLSVTAQNDDEDESKHERQKKKQKIKKQEQLLARLQALLHSSDTNSRNAIVEVLNYFLNRLASQQTYARQLAVKGLSMVLSKSHLSQLMPAEEDEDSDVMEVDENPATAIIPSHRWLLELLPSLPQFKSIKETVCSALRQACQVETSAAAVSAYIVFLSQHSIDLQLQAMDELLVDLGQLIVERPTLINHLLPIEGVTDDRSNLVLVAMINMFYGYLERAQQPQEGYLWSNQTDQVLLQWPNGKSATMNILVVHAMIILLTYAKPRGESKYKEMLQNWFPKDGHPPTAYLVDTSEEALLLPDWLKLRMIRSSNLRLVDAALVDLEAGQLLLFVQSFGIPVQSMSRLLACLDRAVDVDGPAMEEAVVDRGYMAQLIEVQHMRGATGGEKFHQTLVPNDGKQSEMDTAPPKPERRQRSLSTLTKGQEAKTAQLDRDAVVAILTKIFHSPTVSSVERRDLHRTLIQGLSKEPHFWKTVLKALQKLAAQENFVRSLCEQPNQTSALLRIIISKHGAKGISGGLVEVLKAIIQVLPEKMTSLSTLVKSVLSKHEKVMLKDGVKQNLVMMKKVTKTPEDLLQAVVLNEETQKSPLLEKYLEQCIRESVDEQRSKQCTASLTTVLAESDKVPQNLSGLLVDWLSLLDTNIVSQCPDLQMELLFAKQQQKVVGENAMDTGNVRPRGRRTMPYLLALLTHQGSWNSLHKCIHLLLSNGQTQDRFDSSCVLDFLWACLHIPRIWQGRDKKPTKNYKAEDVLNLTEDQIKAVVFYILMEASKADESGGNQNISALAAEAIDKRMLLLMACCCNRGNLIRSTFDYLHLKLKDNKKDWNLCHHLLVQLYLRAPHMSGIDSDTQCSQPDDLQTASSGFSQLDSLSHHLLTALGNAGPGSKSENAMLDANIACRKLAAQHPVLMLRQMPLIASLLQGKAQFSFGEIKHQNALTLFTLILSLLELLQPYIFHPSYSSFKDVLESYFELIKNHGLHNRQLGSVTVKFVQLTLNFMSSDSMRASRILRKYTGILNYLTTTYPDFPALKSLLTGLALPQQEIKSDTEPLTFSSSEMTLTPVRPGSPWSVAQLQPFQNKLQKSSSVENTLTVLNDLDDASKRRVDILEHFVGDLTRLMRHTAPAVRDLAHSLVMRYVRHDPGSSSQFLNVFLQCLDSEDQEIVNAALRNLPEFAVLAQEHAVTILQKAFLVSISSKVDATTTLTETLQLLNMETVQ